MATGDCDVICVQLIIKNVVVVGNGWMDYDTNRIHRCDLLRCVALPTFISRTLPTATSPPIIVSVGQRSVTTFYKSERRYHNNKMFVLNNIAWIETQTTTECANWWVSFVG